ncbi:PAS domain-containing protein [Altibacter sp.]|uniref:PAS domain-containing protein n=1 Tax=Altibacter sp. TaxID=2024823 RepID=UPI0034324713
MNIYISIFLEFLLISTSILFLFKFRKKMGLAPLYILLGTVQYIQALSNTMVAFEIFDRFTIYPGSVILFSAVLFAVLLIYIKEGVTSARMLIIGIIISNLVLSALFGITYQQELVLGNNQDLNAVSSFLINYKFFIVGTVILLVDFILLGIIYQFLISKIKKLNYLLVLFISLLSVLIFDAFAFNIILRYDSPDLVNSIVGHIIGKSFSALIFSVILYVYLKFVDDDKKNTAFIANQNRDVLSILTYKQKFLDLLVEKKQVESKLTSQLETTLHNISDGFVSLDTNWCYTYVNKKGAEFLGKSPETLIGKHIWTEFPEGVDLPFYKAYYKAVETQKTIYFEEYYEPFDRWFENRIYPSPDGLTIYFTDITAKRKAELALKESENHIRTILETEPECIKQLSTKGELIYMNPAGLAMIEAENLDMVKGHSILGLILPEHQKAFKELNSKVFKGQSGRLEFEIKGLKGTKRWLETHAVPFKDTDGNIISLLGVTRDVTHRKLAETALIKSEQYLENIINNIGDPVFVKDEQSHILLVNDAFCKIFNLSKQDIIGKTLAENVPSQERESFLSIDRHVLETGLENVNEETLTVNANETRIISTKKTRFIDDSGTKFLIGTIRDITGRKKDEEELEKHKNNLEEIVKLRTEEVNSKNTELQRMNKLFVGRELKMKELKNIIQELQFKKDS